MALETKVKLHGLTLTGAEERRVHKRLHALERRLIHRPEPTAELGLRPHGAQRQVQADLRLTLGPLGPRLVSHQTAETADHAVRLAIEDVERQLERRQARQRGEQTYGVPSRRLPAALRPHPPGRSQGKEPTPPTDTTEAE
jgi:ribosome-associated translation inhibitor RaiA